MYDNPELGKLHEKKETFESISKKVEEVCSLRGYKCEVDNDMSSDESLVYEVRNDNDELVGQIGVENDDTLGATIMFKPNGRVAATGLYSREQLNPGTDVGILMHRYMDEWERKKPN